MSQEIFIVVHRQELRYTGGAHDTVRFLFATMDKEEAESFVIEANQRYKARVRVSWEYGGLYRKDPLFSDTSAWDDHERRAKEAQEQLLLLDPTFDGIRNIPMEYAIVPMTLKSPV